MWSQMFISSQSKLSMESKKFFNKSYQANWPKGGYGIKSQIMQSTGHKCSFRHNLNQASNQTNSLTKVVKLNSQKKDMK